MTNEERELAAILDAPKVDEEQMLQAELDEIFEDGTPLSPPHDGETAPQRHDTGAHDRTDTAGNTIHHVSNQFINQAARKRMHT